MASIRLVLLELGKLSTKVDRLITDVAENTSDLKDVNKKIVRFETALYVGGALIGLFLAAFWFVFGGDIRTLADRVVHEPPAQTQPAEQPQQPRSRR